MLGVLALCAGTAGVTLLRNAPATRAELTTGPEHPAVDVVDPLRVSPSSESARDTTPTSTPGSEPAQPSGTVRLSGTAATATLVRKTLTDDGTLPIPAGVDRVAWWGADFGAERGVSLVAGHVSWHGTTGPFAVLWDSRVGDEVTVRDPEGDTWVYRVVAVETLDKDELGTQAPELFSQDGPHRLVLVTCGGDYLGGTDGYSDNHIVTAEPVSAP
ncbi:class F sortase [Saccharomonospora sp.]|uniref:class F sortase n=1 Tax=Saccharomonospora sp. TaxID=33913 RepID=UPI00342AF1A8